MKISRKARILLSAIALIGMQSYSQAALIAIVDSGSDLTHPDLAPKAWLNPSDDAALGYTGDIHGWNFLNNSSTLVDLTLVNQFSPDVYTYFDVQTRLLNGTESKTVNSAQFNADMAWAKKMTKDKNFMAELNVFGDFAHGTNVAGIAAKDSDQAVLMGITAIGTPKATPTPNASQAQSDPAPDSNASEQRIYKILDEMTGSTAASPTDTDAKIGQYLNLKAAQVANCSFGNSIASVMKLVHIAEIFGGKWFASKAETAQYFDYVMNKIMKVESAELIDASPGTLFVIAAGNDGSNNDTYFTTPANIKKDNTIAVAATVGRVRLASFSNYGATTVEVAAPGVGILSDSPGGKQVRMSGTSQATPYVTNTAGKILDANSRLKPAEVKQILMGTVDVKAFLKGVVASSGVVNPDRAVAAAKLSLSMSLADAITAARASTADLADTVDFPDDIEQATFVTSLRSEFNN